MGVGTNYIGLNRFEEALQPLQTALQLAPDVNEIYIRYSIALLSLGRAQEAVPCMQKIVQRDPKYPYNKAMLAAVLFCSGNKVQGLEVVGAIQKDSVSFEPFFADLARRLTETGRFAYAIALLEPLYESGRITRDLATLLVEGYKAQTLVT
jgi:tetratricopeptide (TPR) repeat protein